MLVVTGASGVATRRSASRGPSTFKMLPGNDATRSVLATMAATAPR